MLVTTTLCCILFIYLFFSTSWTWTICVVIQHFSTVLHEVVWWLFSFCWSLFSATCISRPGPRWPYILVWNGPSTWNPITALPSFHLLNHGLIKVVSHGMKTTSELAVMFGYADDRFVYLFSVTDWAHGSWCNPSGCWGDSQCVGVSRVVDRCQDNKYVVGSKIILFSFLQFNQQLDKQKISC